MAVAPTYVRIQKNGQLTLPAAIRKRLGLKQGDVVAVEETPEGVLIMPRGVLALRDLDHIGAAFREEGVTLEDWMESGRAIRERLYREMYGDPPTTAAE
ncbi:MAG: AbrB/MazE/SpoVT family DNA-binding domain-containing protein [Thermomicrobiales bacterium]